MTPPRVARCLLALLLLAGLARAEPPPGGPPVAAPPGGDLATGPPVATPPVGDLAAGLAELDRLFTELQRPASIARGLELARDLRRRHPASREAAWRLSRAAFHAANLAREDDHVAELGWEGYEAGLRALEHDAPGAEAHYWAGCALGIYARAGSILAVIANGYAGEVERLLREAVRRDRRLNFGGPLEALGRYYWALPWPLRDLEEALRLLRDAARIAPERMRTRAYLGDAYRDADRPALAERHYRICLAGDAARPENPDGEAWRRHCREQLGELRD